MSTKEKKPGLRENEKKWGKDLMTAGWTIIPNVLLERQAAIGLEPADLNILLHLFRHWWRKDNLPHPSKKNIAKCMDVSPSTIQRRIAKMESDGLLSRLKRITAEKGQLSNEYDFSGLIKAATPFAKEHIQTREDRMNEDAERVTRKKPRIKKDIK